MNTMTTSYWTDLEHKMLQGVNTFEEMVPVGIQILGRMKEVREHIVMICGPMSTGGLGSLRKNMDRHRTAVRKAIENDWHVFDQAPFEEAIVRVSKCERYSNSEYCHDILHVFYRGLFSTRIIRELSFLPGWEKSVGATWERREAPEHFMIISDYPTRWL